MDKLIEKAGATPQLAQAIGEALDITLEAANLVTVPMLDARLAQFESKMEARFSSLEKGSRAPKSGRSFSTPVWSSSSLARSPPTIVGSSTARTSSKLAATRVSRRRKPAPITSSRKTTPEPRSSSRSSKRTPPRPKPERTPSSINSAPQRHNATPAVLPGTAGFEPASKANVFIWIATAQRRSSACSIAPKKSTCSSDSSPT